MNNAVDSGKQSYQSLYDHFDLPLMSHLRLEAYGEDIRQHSWVTSEDLRRDAARRKVTRTARLLDRGCDYRAGVYDERSGKVWFHGVLRLTPGGGPQPNISAVETYVGWDGDALLLQDGRKLVALR